MLHEQKQHVSDYILVTGNIKCSRTKYVLLLVDEPSAVASKVLANVWPRVKEMEKGATPYTISTEKDFGITHGTSKSPPFINVLLTLPREKIYQ